jgi:hypothetical protein
MKKVQTLIALSFLSAMTLSSVGCLAPVAMAVAPGTVSSLVPSGGTLLANGMFSKDEKDQKAPAEGTAPEGQVDPNAQPQVTEDAQQTGQTAETAPETKAPAYSIF